MRRLSFWFLLAGIVVLAMAGFLWNDNQNESLALIGLAVFFVSLSTNVKLK